MQLLLLSVLYNNQKVVYFPENLQLIFMLMLKEALYNPKDKIEEGKESNSVYKIPRARGDCNTVYIS